MKEFKLKKLKNLSEIKKKKKKSKSFQYLKLTSILLKSLYYTSSFFFLVECKNGYGKQSFIYFSGSKDFYLT